MEDFNPGQDKQAQKVIFSRRTRMIVHTPLYFHNTTVKLTHTRKHVGLQLDSKLSFNEHTDNKINDVTKGIRFFVSCNLFHHTEAY